MIGFKQRITEILIEQKLASQEQVDRVMAEAMQTKKSFAKILIEQGIVNETKLTELLSKELGLPMISLTKYRIDPTVVKVIPERMAREYRLIALSRFGNRMVVAMADPLNILPLMTSKHSPRSRSIR